MTSSHMRDGDGVPHDVPQPPKIKAGVVSIRCLALRRDGRRAALRRRQASSDDWNAYYQAADRLRDVIGDPYKRQADRRVARERMLLVASCLFMTVMAAAFLALAGP